MKRKLLFLMAAVALFVPSVMAASAPTYDTDVKALFANGTPITIEARTDGVDGALVKWDGGEKLLAATDSVFGGSHASDTKLDTTSITMNGGTLKNVFGGGLHKSHVGTANVTINGGKVTGKTQGGGASSYSSTTCHRPWVENTVTDMSKEKATTIVDKAIVTINGGNLNDIFGGGEGMSYTKNVVLTINKSFDDEVAYVTSGGSNGYVDSAEVNLYGGKINVVQSVNRGQMDNSEIVIDGATVENAYAGAEGTATAEAKINTKATLTILSGTVKNAAAGQSGGPNDRATDVAVLQYVDGTVENIRGDFDDEKIEELVTLTFVAEDFDESVQIPKGTAFTEEEIEDLISDLEDVLDGSGYKFVGFYGDNKFTTEFDLTKPINEDTTVYLKLEEIKEEVKKEENPDTSDINLALILSLVALGSAGTIISYKKRKATN